MLGLLRRYWDTVKYLRPIQVFGRVFYTLMTPKPNLRNAPTRRVHDQSRWKEPARREASLLSWSRFLLLNSVGELDQDGWDNPERSKLWRYNQHYFYDLISRGSRVRYVWHDRLIDHWIKHNKPGSGTGWEAYPTSIRIVNWIKWVLEGGELTASAHHSLAVQARWLSRRVEWHILGNHVIANAKALMFAGFYFDGSEGSFFRSKGCRILLQELEEQFLDDGGHFELSPMYHAVMIEDLLDIINMLLTYEKAISGMEVDLLCRCRQLLPPAMGWLVNLSHPDGKISFFNDATFGVAPTNQELFDYASRLDIEAPSVPNRSHLFRTSGYARLQCGDITVIADVGSIGPDYQPGHAHADTLSFEVSVGEERIFVNSGVSSYDVGETRFRQRQTRAHNTVEAMGRDSTEVWSAFRVADRANIVEREFSDGANEVSLTAGHDGYKRLRQGPYHHRCWKLTDRRLEVRDRLTDGTSQGTARYHLHPDIMAKKTPDQIELTSKSGKKVFVTTSGTKVYLEDSTWHPGFNLSVPSKCLCVPLECGSSLITLEVLASADYPQQ